MNIRGIEMPIHQIKISPWEFFTKWTNYFPISSFIFMIFLANILMLTIGICFWSLTVIGIAGVWFLSAGIFYLFCVIDFLMEEPGILEVHTIGLVFILSLNLQSINQEVGKIADAHVPESVDKDKWETLLKNIEKNRAQTTDTVIGYGKTLRMIQLLRIVHHKILRT